MTTPQLVELFKGVGRVVDAFIMTDSAGRSKGCGMVEFSEPEAAARAIEVWNQKRHPRWSKLIVERARARFADAAAETRAVVAGTRARGRARRRAINEALCVLRPRRRERLTWRAKPFLSSASGGASGGGRALVWLVDRGARACGRGASGGGPHAIGGRTRARAADASERMRPRREWRPEARAVAAEKVAAEGAARSRACSTASALRVEK